VPSEVADVAATRRVAAMARSPYASESANVRERIAAYLRSEIFNGRLPPGTKIDQEAVAAATGASRMPVREALIILEREALLVWSPFRGAFVAELTEQDVRDHFALLAATCRVIIERLRRQEDPTHFQQVIDAIDRCFDSQDENTTLERLADLREAFRAAGISHRLVHEFESLTSSVPLWRFAERQPTHGRDDDRLYEAVGERVIRRLRSDGFWDTTP
jgi:DNA-binding GntR family transcriptional regulator